MRIAFMGTADFSVSALKALLSAGHEVIAVYSQPPRPAGRGKKERLSPVHEFATKIGIPVYTPDNFKGKDERQKFKNLDLDVAVVVAYGLILPQEILDGPKYGCLNIHASLLPRWRGAAPIQRALMAGDAETGIGIMQMEAGLDTGPVLLEKRLPISADDTAASLHDKLSILGAKAILDALENLKERKATAQPAEGISYAKKIDKAEAKINWDKSAEELKNHIHGLSPFPGAWTDKFGGRVKILEAEVIQNSEANVPLLIECGHNSFLSLKRVQRAGKAQMNAHDFANGLRANE